MNPHDDGIGLDEYVDWLIEAGYPIERIDDFDEWLVRFEAALRALPMRQRPDTRCCRMSLLAELPAVAALRAAPRSRCADRAIPRGGARRKTRH